MALHPLEIVMSELKFYVAVSVLLSIFVTGMGLNICLVEVDFNVLHRSLYFGAILSTVCLIPALLGAYRLRNP